MSHSTCTRLSLSSCLNLPFPVFLFICSTHSYYISIGCVRKIGRFWNRQRNHCYNKKRLTITSVDKNVEKVEPSYPVDGNIKCLAALESNLKALKQLNVELTYNLAFILRHTPKGNENLCPHRNLYMMFKAVLFTGDSCAPLSEPSPKL